MIAANRWISTFYDKLVNDRDMAGRLRTASLSEDLADWTTALTAVVVRTFEAHQLLGVAKAHRCRTLPVQRNEYLSLDITAFSSGSVGWRFPVAACELENSPQDDLVAYALWKLLCVKTGLRILFCYRRNDDAIPALLSGLASQVVSAIPLAERTSWPGDTVVVVGTRSGSDTFPYGFFQTWKLNLSTGRFERLDRSS